MPEYTDYLELMIRALEAAAHAQETGDFAGIDVGYDEKNEIDALLPRNGEPEYRKLFVALAFWEGWIDSCNHGWHFYEPITERDWPGLARSIAEDLRNDRDITNSVVLTYFGGQPRPDGPSLWTRLCRIFRARDAG